jgi:hypothetical protein
MPKPVRELLRLVYIKNVSLASVDGMDSLIVEHLRETKPAIYEQIRARLSKK